MIFFKYEALGNDFIITDDTSIDKKAVVRLCDRNFGIGADGILIHYETDEADAGMNIINMDGSYSEMCGNGLRCFVSYLVTEHKLLSNPLKIKTGRGILSAGWSVTKEGVEVAANLGKAEWSGAEIVKRDGKNIYLYGVSMGNPHIVAIPEDNMSKSDAISFAEEFQNKNFLGMEVNFEVVTAVDADRKKASLIVKEKGVGFTLGCGTGGGAVVNAVMKRTGISDGCWDLVFPGGTAGYRVLENGDTVMTGVPNKVFKGEF